MRTGVRDMERFYSNPIKAFGESDSSSASIIQCKGFDKTK